MTPEEFKALKPQFEGVEDSTVQTYLDLAALVVSSDWPANYRSTGLAAYTCHLMTLEGLGDDRESVAQADGTADLQEVRSGAITLKKFADASPGSSYADWLRSTTCGKSFYFMLRAIRGGPRLVNYDAVQPSGYAKDYPLTAYGWPLVFST